MDVVILGSGTAVPDGERFPAGYLVRHRGQRILVDLGPGVLRRIGHLGMDLREIDAVLLTHYHTDHCADVAALLFALRNPRYAGRAPLHIYGGADCAGRGLSTFLQDLQRTWPWCRAGEYELHAHELEPGQFAVEDLEVTAVAIEHTDASLGYRFRDPAGTTAAFSGDAIACEGVVEVAQGADLFVCDAAFPAAHPTEGHMTSVEAGQVAQRAGVTTLCLTHFYPQCRGHDVAAEARTAFDGRVELAQDLWRFDCATGEYRPLEIASDDPDATRS